jgi:hypothetical protein
MLRHVGREEALNVVAAMRSGVVVDLDDRLALEATEVSVETKLALADSVILATARAHDAELWTQDSDFEGLEGVRYRARKWFGLAIPIHDLRLPTSTSASALLAGDRRYEKRHRLRDHARREPRCLLARQ